MSAYLGALGAKGVDYVNIGLVFVAWGFALLAPTPLFLFAYAVLGPLHYLTEISWLHDRKYFIRGSRSVAGFVVASILVTTLVLWGKILPSLLPVLVYLLFGAALILVVAKESRRRKLSFGLLLATAAVFAVLQPPLYAIFFLLLIPTVLHVFFFTGAFMLSGSLKSGSIPGLIGFFVFLLAAGSFFVITPAQESLLPGSYVFESYRPFMRVNASLVDILSPAVAAYSSVEEAVASGLGRSVMHFLAFVYTYHYLNWFSKARVIGWNSISSVRRSLIAGGWVLSLAIYAYDYRIGIWALLSLSFLHVLLEFPLNHRSFADIGGRLISVFRPRLTKT